MYLTCLAGNRPQKWVCEASSALHDVILLDTPVHTQTMSSPFGWDGWVALCCVRPSLPSIATGRKRRRPEHRHIQLALKYSHLGVYTDHLHELLKSYRFTPRLYLFYREPASGHLDPRCFVYPKTVRAQISIFGICHLLPGATKETT
jgi:hypothetical protein